MNCLKCRKKLNEKGECVCGFSIFADKVVFTSPLSGEFLEKANVFYALHKVDIEPPVFEPRKQPLVQLSEPEGKIIAMQRKAIHDLRKNVEDSADSREIIRGFIAETISNIVMKAFGKDKFLNQLSYRLMMDNMEGTFFPKHAVEFTPEEVGRTDAQTFINFFTSKAIETYAAKEAEFIRARVNNPYTPDMRMMERLMLQRVADDYESFLEHPDSIRELQQGLQLRVCAQPNPADAYRAECLHRCDTITAEIRDETVRRLFTIRLKSSQQVNLEHAASIAGELHNGLIKRGPRKVLKVGCNDPCPCGSGKKYKFCCGKDA